MICMLQIVMRPHFVIFPEFLLEILLDYIYTVYVLFSKAIKKIIRHI